jgi:hypothetical protein
VFLAGSLVSEMGAACGFPSWAAFFIVKRLRLCNIARRGDLDWEADLVRNLLVCKGLEVILG